MYLPLSIFRLLPFLLHMPSFRIYRLFCHFPAGIILSGKAFVILKTASFFILP
jgi:hypothetical protein